MNLWEVLFLYDQGRDLAAERDPGFGVQRCINHERLQACRSLTSARPCRAALNQFQAVKRQQIPAACSDIMVLVKHYCTWSNLRNALVQARR